MSPRTFRSSPLQGAAVGLVRRQSWDVQLRMRLRTERWPRVTSSTHCAVLHHGRRQWSTRDTLVRFLNASIAARGHYAITRTTLHPLWCFCAEGRVCRGCRVTFCVAVNLPRAEENHASLRVFFRVAFQQLIHARPGH